MRNEQEAQLLPSQVTDGKLFLQAVSPEHRYLPSRGVKELKLIATTPLPELDAAWPKLARAAALGEDGLSKVLAKTAFDLRDPAASNVTVMLGATHLNADTVPRIIAAVEGLRKHGITGAIRVIAGKASDGLIGTLEPLQLPDAIRAWPEVQDALSITDGTDKASRKRRFLDGLAAGAAPGTEDGFVLLTEADVVALPALNETKHAMTVIEAEELDAVRRARTRLHEPGATWEGLLDEEAKMLDDADATAAHEAAVAAIGAEVSQHMAEAQQAEDTDMDGPTAPSSASAAPSKRRKFRVQIPAESYLLWLKAQAKTWSFATPATHHVRESLVTMVEDIEKIHFRHRRPMEEITDAKLLGPSVLDEEEAAAQQDAVMEADAADTADAAEDATTRKAAAKATYEELLRIVDGRDIDEGVRAAMFRGLQAIGIGDAFVHGFFLSPSGIAKVAGWTRDHGPLTGLFDRLHGMELSGLALRWGNANEPLGREAYCAVTLRKLQDRALQQYGTTKGVSLRFWVPGKLLGYGKQAYMACSFDGILLTRAAEHEPYAVNLVEIKCPIFSAIWRYGARHPYGWHPKNTKPEYAAQILQQQAMWLHAAHGKDHDAGSFRSMVLRNMGLPETTPVNWKSIFTDFVVWQPKRLWVTRHLFCKAAWTALEAEVRGLYFREYLPRAAYKYAGKKLLDSLRATAEAAAKAAEDSKAQRAASSAVKASAAAVGARANDGSAHKHQRIGGSVPAAASICGKSFTMPDVFAL
jgi:hypothetical protein